MSVTVHQTVDPPTHDVHGLDATLRRSGSVGLASLASMAGGLATNKVTAVMVGTAGMGYNSVLVGHAANVALLADLNVTHGMVRQVAAVDRRDASATIAAGLTITLGTSATIIAAVGLAARPLAARLLPARFSAATIVACAIAGCVLMLNSQMQAALSALGALRAYRRALLLQAVAAPVTMWVALGDRGISGLPTAQVAGAIVALMITSAFLAVTVSRLPLCRPQRSDIASKGRCLVQQGTLFTIAAVMGSGVANLLPLFVLNRLGDIAAGQYRAAAVLSAGYVTVLTTTLSREFLPRLSGLVSSIGAFNTAVDRQVRLICALGTPVVLAGIIVSPLAVRVLFSGAFGDATRVLALQFPGDLLRLISQTFVYALIAARGGRGMLVSELAGGAALLVCVYVGVNQLGLPGLGAASTAAYVVYAVVAGALLRANTGFRLSRRSKRMLVASLAAVALPTTLVATLGRFTGAVIATAVLSTCLLLLLGRLLPAAPSPIARFAHWVDAHVLGPTSLADPQEALS